MNGGLLWATIFLYAAIAALLTHQGEADDHAPVRAGKSSHGLSLVTDEKLKDGEEKLKEFERNAHGSDCWKMAVDRLKEGCAELSDESQGRLALDLTNCHLLQFDRQVYPCRPHDKLADCTRNMDDAAFGALSTFRAHTNNVCFFLANQLWQERTEKTVNDLSGTSQHVVNQLQETAEQNDELLRLQGTALTNQKVMLSNVSVMQERLKDASKQAADMRQDLDKQWSLWRNNFGEVFDYLNHIDGWVSYIGLTVRMAEKLCAYILLSVLVHTITSVQSTAKARPLAFFIIVAGFLLEYMLMQVVMWWQNGPADDSPFLQAINYCTRRILLLGCFVKISWTFLHYEDPYQKLECLEKTVAEMHQALSPKKEASTMLRGHVSADGNDSTHDLSHTDSVHLSGTSEADAASTAHLTPLPVATRREVMMSLRGMDSVDGEGGGIGLLTGSSLDDSGLGEISPAEDEEDACGNQTPGPGSASPRKMPSHHHVAAVASRGKPLRTPKGNKMQSTGTSRASSPYYLRPRTATPRLGANDATTKKRP